MPRNMAAAEPAHRKRHIALLISSSVLMSFAFTLPRIPYWIALEPRAMLDLCLHDEMFSSCMNTCSCPRIQLATLFAASFLLLTTFSCSSLMCHLVFAKAFDPFCWRLSFRDSRLRRSGSSTLALTVEPSENVIWVETPISKPMAVSGTNFSISIRAQSKLMDSGMRAQKPRSRDRRTHSTHTCLPVA